MPHMAAALGSTYVLCVVDCIRQRAYLHSNLVAVFVLQRAVWPGTPAGFCSVSCAASRVSGGVHRKPQKKAGCLEFAGAAGDGQLSVNLCRRTHHAEGGAS